MVFKGGVKYSSGSSSGPLVERRGSAGGCVSGCGHEIGGDMVR